MQLTGMSRTSAVSPAFLQDHKSVMTCFRDLIGVKFEYGGRGPDSYDCWGLVRECHHRHHGVLLPDCGSTDSLLLNSQAVDQHISEWEPLPDIDTGAVLLMRIKGFGAHVGFATSKTRFLQAMENQGVISSRVSLYRRQIIGAYRYAG